MEKREFKKKEPESNTVTISSEFFFKCPLCSHELKTKKEKIGEPKICIKCFANVQVPEKDGESIPYGVVCFDEKKFQRRLWKFVTLWLPILILASFLCTLGLFAYWGVGAEKDKAHNRKIFRQLEQMEELLAASKSPSHRVLKDAAKELVAIEGADKENAIKAEAIKNKVLTLWQKSQTE